MTMITFRNDEDRANFQITMALTMLRNEVRFGLLACDPRKGTTVRTLRRYWPNLKKTRKAAYKQLVDAGIYEQLDVKKN
jgi:hypothetical protein